MIIGTVKGEIVATIEHPFYTGRKKLIVEKQDSAGNPTGYLIAIDSGVAAGPGDRVLVLDEGNSARQIVNSANAPVRSIIIGIVDHIHTGA
jgi:microcompartment protein CcmK/EutM